MASLDIPSEANDEDADIIFDYSSDENPYENPYTEYNFAQKRHYANTCPKRGEKKETEVLKIAYDLGYEPLEDSDIDSDIEIYAYTNSSDYSSDTSSNHE
ncbi:hypothetical protein Tco_0252638 [Tanacetum coccineum]|uniref:Uncharacterized protein n=1 Tax=Tanacetum coccineum TaxID=301880 RepID=A0ABQ4XDR5_9ASTR